RAPFRASTVVETLDLVRNADPAAPRNLVPQVPRDLETICLKCLNKAVAMRYATAADLADDLERFLEKRPISARRTVVLEPAVQWSRRHRARAALAAGLSLVAVLVPLALAFHSQRLKEANDALTAKSSEAETSAKEAQAAARQSRINEYLSDVRLAATYLADG